MSFMKYLAAPLRYRLWRPTNLRLVADDLRAVSSQPAGSHGDHLVAAIDWLCRAQDARAGRPDAGGVSAGWNFGDGWLPGYPETTGYIIETFVEAAAQLKRPELVERARRMIDWELSIQHPDGAFPGHHGEPGSRPVIFNTGQIMHGMLTAYARLGRKECLESAVKAGHWLARHQDADGCWRKFEFYDTPHTYNTRGTWALLHTAILAGDDVLKKAAVRNLDWALTQQTPCGWFRTNAFLPDRSPYTHTIAYAMRGFLESGALLGEQRYLQAAARVGRGMAAVQRDDGYLAGTYADEWKATSGYSCLTGVAQMSVNWLRLAQCAGVPELRNAARRGIAYLKRNQRLTDPSPEVRGGIAGSAPVWGEYARLEFPNWSAKFFADALMMDMADVAVPALGAPAPGQEARTHG